MKRPTKVRPGRTIDPRKKQWLKTKAEYQGSGLQG